MISYFAYFLSPSVTIFKHIFCPLFAALYIATLKTAYAIRTPIPVIFVNGTLKTTPSTHITNPGSTMPSVFPKGSRLWHCLNNTCDKGIDITVISNKYISHCRNIVPSFFPSIMYGRLTAASTHAAKISMAFISSSFVIVADVAFFEILFDIFFTLLLYFSISIMPNFFKKTQFFAKN